MFSIYRSKVVDFLDLSLLYQPVYVNICLGMALALFSDLTFFTIQPTYLRELSFDKMDTAYVVSIGASADLGSRVVVTIVSSCTTKIKARHLFLAGMIATIAAQFGKLISSIYILRTAKKANPKSRLFCCLYFQFSFTSLVSRESQWLQHCWDFSALGCTFRWQ